MCKSQAQVLEIVLYCSCTNAAVHWHLCKEVKHRYILENGLYCTCTNTSVLNLAFWLAGSKLHLIIHDDDGGDEEFTKETEI